MTFVIKILNRYPWHISAVILAGLAVSMIAVTDYVHNVLRPAQE